MPRALRRPRQAEPQQAPLRPFESLRVAPSLVEGRQAQGRLKDAVATKRRPAVPTRKKAADAAVAVHRLR